VGIRIFTSWLASPSESNPDFGGYRLYRAIGKPDTTYEEIFACGYGTDQALTYYYDDISPVRGQEYYYYLVAYDDGTENITNINPSGSTS